MNVRPNVDPAPADSSDLQLPDLTSAVLLEGCSIQYQQVCGVDWGKQRSSAGVGTLLEALDEHLLPLAVSRLFIVAPLDLEALDVRLTDRVAKTTKAVEVCAENTAARVHSLNQH